MSKSKLMKSLLTVLAIATIMVQAAAQSVSSGASREVKGTVFDGQEQPLMGVAVLIAGTTSGGGNRLGWQLFN